MERRTRAPAPSACSMARKTLRMARGMDMAEGIGMVVGLDSLWENPKLGSDDDNVVVVVVGSLDRTRNVVADVVMLEMCCKRYETVGDCVAS